MVQLERITHTTKDKGRPYLVPAFWHRLGRAMCPRAVWCPGIVQGVPCVRVPSGALASFRACHVSACRLVSWHRSGRAMCPRAVWCRGSSGRAMFPACRLVPWHRSGRAACNRQNPAPPCVFIIYVPAPVCYRSSEISPIFRTVKSVSFSMSSRTPYSL